MAEGRFGSSAIRGVLQICGEIIMRIIPVILLTILCISCQHGRSLHAAKTLSSGSNEIVHLELCQFGANLYFFQTTRAELNSAPKWRANADFPPLAPRKAEAAALKEAQRIDPSIDKWVRESICLRELDDDCWCYQIRFYPLVPMAGLPQRLDVPVLMNGQVVHATTEPRKK